MLYLGSAITLALVIAQKWKNCSHAKN